MRTPAPAPVSFGAPDAGAESGRQPEFDGGIERLLHERGRDLDGWFFAVRTIFAVGLIGFLMIDLFEGARPLVAAAGALTGYVVANVLCWTMVGSRTGHARWLYMAIDVGFLLLARHAFQVEVVVDPNATMVGMYTLLLLTYTIYGDPELTSALGAVAVLSTIGSIASDYAFGGALQPGLAIYHTYPLRAVLLVAYLTAFCALTIGLSRRLRVHLVEHGNEFLKRLEATLSSEVERSRREKIEELNRLKRDFISVLSHELRTPLTPLRSSLELMRRADEDGSACSELLDIALESTDKLQRLVLDYTQLAELLTERGRAHARRNFDLSALIDILRRGTDFSRVATSGMKDLYVSVDPKLLAAGLLALLRRAQLVSTTSTISLRGFEHEAGVTLSVHDPESFVDRDLSQVLDDPFGLSSERAFGSPNTGLELVLARYALRRAGGALRVTSSERLGTTAICNLPGETPGLDWLDPSQIEYEIESLLLYAVR